MKKKKDKKMSGYAKIRSTQLLKSLGSKENISAYFKAIRAKRKIYN